jgi:HK97 family phage prohead protease
MCAGDKSCLPCALHNLDQLLAKALPSEDVVDPSEKMKGIDRGIDDLRLKYIDQTIDALSGLENEGDPIDIIVRIPANHDDIVLHPEEDGDITVTEPNENESHEVEPGEIYQEPDEEEFVINAPSEENDAMEVTTESDEEAKTPDSGEMTQTPEQALDVLDGTTDASDVKKDKNIDIPIDNHLIDILNETLGLEQQGFNLEQVLMGLKSELEEHDTNNPETDAIDNISQAVQLVLGHLQETPDYYTKIKTIEGDDVEKSKFTVMAKDSVAGPIPPGDDMEGIFDKDNSGDEADDSVDDDGDFDKEGEGGALVSADVNTDTAGGAIVSRRKKDGFLAKSDGVHQDFEDKILGEFRFEKSIDDEYIIYGLASSDVLDKQNHVVTLKALQKAVPKFMANEKFRNIQVFHTNIQVGEVIDAFTTKDGKTYKTEVDDKGWWIAVRLRKDIITAKNVIREIEAGNLNGFSISGNATVRHTECDSKSCYIVIDDMEIYEVSICQVPVQPEAHFVVINRGLSDCQDCVVPRFP